MKTLRIVIAILFLAATLVTTLTVAASVPAGPPTPDMECEGYVCMEHGGCPLPQTAIECNNACWVGGYLRCMDGMGWRCTLWCPD